MTGAWGALIAIALQAAAQPKAALPGLTLVGLPPELATVWNEHLAQHLEGFQVVTQADIASLLGMERQKQLLGCETDSAACFAELADGLGADVIVLGDLTRVGTLIQLNLKLIRANDGKRLAVFSKRLERQEDVFTALEEGAVILSRATEEFGRPARRSTMPFAVPVGIGALAVVLGGVGVGLELAASSDHSALLASERPSGDVTPEALASNGRTKQTMAITCWVGAGVAAVAAVALYVFGVRTPAAVALLLGSSGLGLAGLWP